MTEGTNLSHLIMIGKDQRLQSEAMWLNLTHRHAVFIQCYIHKDFINLVYFA